MKASVVRLTSTTLAVLFVLGVAACGPETNSPRPSASLAFVACGDVEAGPAATIAPRHKFCAQIPFSESTGDTRTVQLLLVSDQASAPLENRRVLVYHPGGPGISAVQLTSQDPPSVDLSKYVVLTWDGTSASTTPGTCGPKSLAFGTARNRDDLAAKAQEVGHECLFGFGGPDDIGARSASDELEAIRLALGVKDFDLLMASYGTAIGEAYLRAHRSSVARAVLDAPIALEVQWSDRLVAVSQALTGRAAELAASCNVPRCASLAGSDSTLSMARIKQAVLSSDPTVGGGQTHLTPTMFDQAVELTLRSHAYWDTWTHAIDEALAGDGTDLWALGEKEYFDLDRAVFYRSLCADILRPGDAGLYATPTDDLLFAYTSALAPCSVFPHRDLTH